MSIIYVQWNKSIDAAFRAFYPIIAVNGEQIQQEPAQNTTDYMVGTSRLTEAGQSALTAEFGNNVAFLTEMPGEFMTQTLIG